MSVSPLAVGAQRRRWNADYENATVPSDVHAIRACLALPCRGLRPLTMQFPQSCARELDELAGLVLRWTWCPVEEGLGTSPSLGRF